MYKRQQSYLFNQVCAERIRSGGFDTVWHGDIAVKHSSGGLFLVEDVGQELPRFAAWEISPTGPIFGWAMPIAAGKEGQIESGLLEKENLRVEDFRNALPGLKLRGTRRPFRAKPWDLFWDVKEDSLILYFRLEKGVYATSFIREIVKEGKKNPSNT